MNDHALSLRDVSVAYDHNVALSHITLDVAAGEFVGVIGPNGAGKSTLLNAILGLVPLLHGQVLINGRRVGQARADLAYMPQREVVDWTFPVTVQDVVMMGRQACLGWFRRPGEADRAAIEDALARVGMLEHQYTPIGNLSGGQQQRVFFARALAQQGMVILLDEPLTGVDATTEQDLFQLLQALSHEGRTVILTTHDLGAARVVCTKLLFLNRAAIAYGTPAESFTAEVLEKTYGSHAIHLPADASVAAPLDEALLMLRDDSHHTHS